MANTARRLVSAGSAPRKASAALAMAARGASPTSTAAAGTDGAGGGAGGWPGADRASAPAAALAASRWRRRRRVSRKRGACPMPLRVLDGAAVRARDRGLYRLAGADRLERRPHVVAGAGDVG